MRLNVNMSEYRLFVDVTDSTILRSIVIEFAIFSLA